MPTEIHQQSGIIVPDVPEKETVYTNNTQMSIQHVTGDLLLKYKPEEIIDISSGNTDKETIIILLSSKAIIKI